MKAWLSPRGLLMAALVVGGRGSLASAAPLDTAESHHAAGMEHLRAGRSPEALAEFRTALRLDHDHLPSLVQTADMLSASDRVFEAYGILQHAVEIAPGSAEAHALRGRCFSRLERLADAREELRRAIELNPGLTEPYYGLAVVEARQGRLAEARRHVEAFLKRTPNTDAQELHASICFDTEDYDAALTEYRTLARAHPEVLTYAREIGRVQMAAGRYAEAQETYSALAKKGPEDKETLRALYDASYKRGDYGSAVEALEALSRVDPKSCEPLVLLARSYHRLAQFGEARQRAARCLELEPGHAGAHFLIGWTWLGEGDLPKAKAEFVEALKADPKSVEALYWSATVELRLHNRPGAVRLLEGAVGVDPDHMGVRYELAQAYAAEGQAGQAAKQFEEFRRLKGREAWTQGAAGPDAAGHLEDWIGFANYLLGEKKPREALAVLDPARKTPPANAEVLRLTAVARALIGEVEEALAAYAEAQKLGPTARLYWGRGTLYRRLGEDALALADLRRSLSKGLSARDEAEAHLVIASIARQGRRWAEAEAELRRSSALDPGGVAARVLLAEALVQSGKAEEAVREARRALADHPEAVEAWLALARAAVEARQYADATGGITRAAALEGESARVLLARGRLAAAQGARDQALDFLGRAAQADPSRAEVFDLLGSLYVENGRLSEAAVTFEKATIVDPTDAASWVSLGRIYLGAKRAPAAVKYFEKAVSVAPDDAEARYRLALALQQTGRVAEAEAAARQAKALGHAGADALLLSLAGVAR
jgi:tetratricopeptide (TPR) repeat protein